MTKPVRLQLSRKVGFSIERLSRETNGLPVVNVARPSRWGNPWRIGPRFESGGVVIPEVTRESAVQIYRDYWSLMLTPDYPGIEAVRASLQELRGKNLACWCKPGEPCHADVLLELANA